jgi:hypothetical protein
MLDSDRYPDEVQSRTTEGFVMADNAFILLRMIQSYAKTPDQKAKANDYYGYVQRQGYNADRQVAELAKVLLTGLVDSNWPWSPTTDRTARYGGPQGVNSPISRIDWGAKPEEEQDNETVQPAHDIPELRRQYLEIISRNITNEQMSQANKYWDNTMPILMSELYNMTRNVSRRADLRQQTTTENTETTG